jgi:glutamate decarboxylase
VIAVGVDGNHRIDLGKLRQTIRRLQSPSVGNGKTKIIAVVGIAGTTETGNVDPLDRLGDIARDIGAYFHVDACWGGAALMVDGYSPLFKGLERADSVTIDAHKLLYCPTAMGMVLFRDEKDLGLTKQASQHIIRKDSVDIGRFTVEGSRPFSCLKTWASLKIIGREGYGLLLKKARENTAYMKTRLDGNDDFETLNRPELFILIYRFIPKKVRDEIGLRQTAGCYNNRRDGTIDRKTISSVNRLLNNLNIRLHRELRRDDRAFVSRTTCRMKQNGSQSLVVLRAVLINPLTNHQIIDEIVAMQERIGKGLWKAFEPDYRRIAGESNDWGDSSFPEGIQD